MSRRQTRATLRDAIGEYLANGHTRVEAADAFGFPVETIKRIEAAYLTSLGATPS